MSTKKYAPRAVFQKLEEFIEQYKTIQSSNQPYVLIDQWLSFCLGDTSIPKFEAQNSPAKDYQAVLGFLYSYRGSPDTFVAYRRDLERFIQWSWFIKGQSVLSHKRQNIEEFIEFCQKPPKRWIGFKKVPRFKTVNGEKSPNPEWKPFEIHLSKVDHKKGIERDKDKYQISQETLKALFGVLGSFYNYLLQEELSQMNPVSMIRQKSKFIQKQSTTPMIRRLSNTQWEMVLECTREKAIKNKSYERTVFMLSCLYAMYLRISELAATDRWTPTMGDFYKDSEKNWWFKTVGKGNKARQIAVSESMLEALKHYRIEYLKLPPLPTLNEKTPLIGHIKNPNKPVTSTRPIREIVQQCFYDAADQLESSGKTEEANGLRIATVHWLRHTGISEDVKIRPREHVRDDAGHSSSAITDKYIDIEHKERAKSARNKKL
ncbi:MAG: site-specific integrase [Alphaproteobacteria bacterium]|nr:site-specific integrase [Alphaproteobacteria bacterium]